MATVTNYHTPYALRKLEKACSFFSCDCISEETAIKIGKVALGVLAFVVVTPLIGLAVERVADLLVSYGCDISPKQDAMQIWDQLSTLPAFFSIPLKTVLGVYIVALGPIFEEFVFREVFRNLSETIVHGIGQDPNTFWGKVEMVLLNGLAFTTIHLSLEQGWTNVIMFVFTFLWGCVLSILRETTGDIIAPSAAHIANNSVSMINFLFFT